jgi:electron transport complex protein RnfB
MHTVIVSECTGCDLCVEPCPVDCIDMLREEESLQTWHWQLPDPTNRRVNIIASDAAQDESSRDRAA